MQTTAQIQTKKSQLLDNLNQEQLNAVTHGSGPLLIVAGAGTGKTTVITRRIAYLAEQGVAKLEEIAALTFTEKAAGEMQERVDLLMPLGYYDSWICTFHGFCERIIKNHALDIGLPTDFELLDNIGQWVFVYKNLDKFKLKYYKPLGNPAKFIDALLRHFSRCKDELITPEQYLHHAESLKLNTDTPQGAVKPKAKKGKKNQTSETQNTTEVPAPDMDEIERMAEIANAYHTYQRLMLEHNYLDFADLINYTLELFQKRPHILKYYQNKFKHILVDEFQDTNFAQYQLVKLLSSGHNNLVVVGDDDQSIYKFRGASVSNILKFKDDYPHFKQITLVQNYRSSQNILDLAYNFIQQNNPDRLEVKLAIDKKLKSTSKEEGVIEVMEAEDLAGELDMVAKKMLEIKNGNAEATWNDFAVLIRRNAAADELLPVLASRGIPYTFVANKGLFKKPIILDVLAYVRLLENGHNSGSLYRVLCLPKFQLTHTELSALLAFGHKKALTLFESLQQAGSLPELGQEAQKKIQNLLKCLGEHTQIASRHSAAEVIVRVLKDLGIEEKIKEDTLENAENRELVEQFYKKVELFEQQNHDTTLHNFLQILDLEMQAGSEGDIKFDPNLGPESVKVMTVHAAKGLEFNYVFIINLVEQRFPTREKSDPIEIPEALVKDILPEGDFHLQEERRLFYVALTRAKTHVYLSWAKDYGGARQKRPSQFLIETGLVPSEKVNKATGKVVFTRPVREQVKFHILPTQFSYSQLNDFETCPLKYKYQHYLKLPVPGSCHTSFGQTIHKVFEEYLKAYKNALDFPQQDLFSGPAQQPAGLPEFILLERLYDKCWVDDWYKDKTEKEEYRDLGKKMLKTFYNELAQKPFVPKYIEKFFRLKLAGYTFVGKIDRADSLNGGIEILDYKTGKVPKSGKDLDQLYIYQWAAQEFLNERVVALKYWYLQDNQFLEEKLADTKKLEGLKAKLLELIQEIIETTKYDLFKEAHNKVRDHACEFENLE